MSEWFWSEESVRRGPCSGRELKELVAAGRVQPTTLVCQAGMNEWVAASTVKGLFVADAAQLPKANVESTGTPAAMADASCVDFTPVTAATDSASPQGVSRTQKYARILRWLFTEGWRSVVQAVVHLWRLSQWLWAAARRRIGSTDARSQFEIEFPRLHDPVRVLRR